MQAENVFPLGALFLAFGTKRLFQMSILKAHEWVIALYNMTFKHHMTDKITEQTAR